MRSQSTPVIPRSEATRNLSLDEEEILRFAQDDKTSVDGSVIALHFRSDLTPTAPHCTVAWWRTLILTGETA
jgi:hypothetical protein